MKICLQKNTRSSVKQWCNGMVIKVFNSKIQGNKSIEDKTQWDNWCCNETKMIRAREPIEMGVLFWVFSMYVGCEIKFQKAKKCT